MDIYIELDWEDPYDPLYGSPIELPANTILWRGYDSRYPSVGDRYAYYSSREIATTYIVGPERKLGCFVTTKPIRILDIHFMMTILSRLIEANRDSEYIQDFASCMLSFGLCSLSHQIIMTENRYRETMERGTAPEIVEGIKHMRKMHIPHTIIEQKGIRIAETTNDGATMSFLKELFETNYDGFISPRLKTEFHVDKGKVLHPELILFNPERSGIKQIIQYPSNIIYRSIGQFIEDKHRLIHIGKQYKIKSLHMNYYVSGGKTRKRKRSSNTKHPLDDFEDQIYENNSEICAIEKSAKEAGRRWRKKFQIHVGIPVPTCEVSPWTETTL